MSLPLVPYDAIDDKNHRTLVSQTLNSVVNGRANVTGTVTLTAGTVTTSVSDNLFGSSYVPVLVPTTANAAAALGTTYVSTRVNGSFTLTHANNAQTDRTFLYVRWG